MTAERTDTLHRIATLVAECADALTARGWTLATAESCTGGMIAAACTDRAGSSAWFERGVVSYSNEAKTELLGVPPALITVHGAVSCEVAEAMATGALAHSRATVAVAVTGIAGPGGAVPGKPVGTVWLAWAVRGGVCHSRLLRLAGDRVAVRLQAVDAALLAVLDAARGD